MDFLYQEYYGNPVYRYIIGAVAIVTGYIVGVVVRRISRGKLKAYAETTETKLDDILAGVLGTPPTIFFSILGLYVAAQVIRLPPNVQSLVNKGLVLAITLATVLTLSKILDQIFKVLIEPRIKQTDSRLDDQVAILVKKSLKLALWLLSILIILGNLGYNVLSLLTAAGVTGIAIAMAAKDTLSNIFGGVTILIDRPIHVGDIVKVKDVTGIVEEIGLRTTRVRTFDGHLVSIPNSAAAISVLENVSARPHLRVLFKLGVKCSTPRDRLDSVQETIKGVITGVEGLSTEKDPSVHLVEFGPHSLDFQVIYYIADTSRTLDIKHEINTGILRAFGEAGIQIPYPTQAVVQLSENAA